MFDDIPGACKSRRTQLTNSLGEVAPIAPSVCEASCPETNVISLEHRANRAMFQNKPATRASSEWCEFCL